jgi:VWFA-related protein
MKPGSQRRTGFLGMLMGVLAVSLSAYAQSSPSPQEGGAPRVSEPLRTNTRLVVVDVVVTNSKGQPVSDLKAEDFALLEAGKPQTISGFSFQHSGGPSAAAHAVQLPPNVVSNAPQYKSNSLNVVLFDALNGELTSQAYAKDQLAKFFSTATLDRPVAIFVLERQLKLLHDFTTDGAALKSAIEKYSPPAKTNVTESFDSRRSIYSTKGDYHTDVLSIETTLNQLNILAKMLAGYPGRKNLIWLSESFPLNLFPDSVLRSAMSAADIGGQTADGTFATAAPMRADPNTFDRMVEPGGARDFAGMIKKVADALMNAQVAVYPVDAAGVGRNDRIASQQTMTDVASRTGGKAFVNTNNLTMSIGAGLDDGATYYTLSYYPDNKKWDGQFRSIEIKTGRADVKLRHRIGYYALDPEKLRKEDSDKVAENLSRMLEFDAPAATAVLFQAGVVPPSDKTKNKLLVNFAIDPRSIAFERTSDGMEHARIVCTVWAYGKNKEKPNMSESDITKADLKPDVYQQVMKQYFPCSRTLELKPGAYTLKLGVLDRTTNLIGTTVATVTVQ